jgi:cold shock CspA family protein
MNSSPSLPSPPSRDTAAPLVPEQRFRKSESESAPFDTRNSKLETPRPLRTALHGRVVSWVVNCGYGFIRHPDFARDLFVHCSDIADYPATNELRVPSEVLFDVVPSEKGSGYAAINVRTL